MDKALLRTLCLERRRQLAPETHQTRSAAVTCRLMQHLKTMPLQHLHVFLPMVQYREYDTWGLLFELWAQRPELATWTTRLCEGQLYHASFNADTILRPNAWGCVEPLTRERRSDAELAARKGLVVLAPLLAFDKRGYRLGYGKGCYDRLIGALPAETPVFGVSLAPPFDVLPGTKPHDKPLSACFTPTRTYRFAS